jgi:Spy/CpxP family protein refolding chaperone
MSGVGILGFEQVQRELKLTEEQTQKLREISRTAMARRPTSVLLAGMSREERLAKQADLLKLDLEDEEKAKAVLSPQQLAQVKEIGFRMYVQRAMYGERIFDAIGASEDQKAQLRKLGEEFQDKVTKVQQETVESAMKVLTPEQQKKLREMMEKQSARLPGL